MKKKYLPQFQCIVCLLIFLSAFTSCKDKQASQKDVVIDTIEKAEVAVESTKKEKKSILCFGNSLTAGYGLDEKDAWPTLLQDRLDSMELNYRVINAGLSGETTAGGINRLDWVTKQVPDIFLLELGANDMLRGLDVKNTRSNLDSILTSVQIKKKGMPMILAGMLAPPNMGAAYQRAYNNIFPELAQKHKAVLIPFLLDGVAGKTELNLPDGKHPNALGQKIVLENVWYALQPLLDENLN